MSTKTLSDGRRLDGGDNALWDYIDTHITGPTGPTGSQGNQGFLGITGPTGSQGSQGNQGFLGITGPTGSQGNQGVVGAAGTQGNQGVPGTQGNQGVVGAAGTQGNQGVPGTQGNQGVSGATAHTQSASTVTAGTFDTGTFAFPGVLSYASKEIVQASTDTLTAAECYNTIINNYGQGAENTQTLPTAAVGLTFMVIIGTSGTGAFHVKAGPSDKIYKDGVALDDGDKVSLATPGVGNSASFFCFQTGSSTYDWYCTTLAGTWTDGGA